MPVILLQHPVLALAALLTASKTLVAFMPSAMMYMDQPLKRDYA